VEVIWQNYYQLSWSEWFNFILLEDEARWENLSAKSGVYLLKRRQPLERIGGIDPKGIL
jgi:hypothetical protein